MDRYVRMVMWSGCLSAVVACSVRALSINLKDGYVMHKKRTVPLNKFKKFVHEQMRTHSLSHGGYAVKT